MVPTRWMVSPRAQLVVEILVDVLLVLPRQDDLADAGAPGRQHLLLDAADRQHRPDSVISPVIATSPRTGRRVSSDTSAVAMVTPADGPSFGIAPDGTCTWISDVLKKSGSMLHCGRVRAHPRQRRARRLLHHVAELAGERQRRRAGHARRLDEEHLAADRRPGQADGHARLLGALVHLLVEELRRAEQLVHDVRRDRHAVSSALGAAPRHLAADARRSRARGCARRPRACSRG